MKKSFILKLAFSALAVGALAGCGQKLQQLKAESVPENIYFKWTGSEWANWGAEIGDMYAYFFNDSDAATGNSWHGNKANDTTTKDEVEYCVFAVPEGSTKVVFNFVHDGWDEGDWAHQTNNLNIPTDGKDLFVLGTVRDESTGWKYNGTWSTFDSKKYSVTKYAVIDGELQAEALGVDSIDEGSNYNVPDAITIKGYHFAGWYSDVDCLIEFNGVEAIDEGVSIYARYVTFSPTEEYIAYVTEAKEDAFTHAYFYGEYEPVAWPGARISDIAMEVTNDKVLEFNGLKQLIYLIPVPSTEKANYKMVLTNEAGSAQTYDIDVTNRAAYYTWKNEEEYKYSWSANEDAFKAIYLVAGIDLNRNRVVADEEEGIKAYSICGLDKRTIASMLDYYDSLSDEAKAMVNNSFTYTYARDGRVDEETSIPVEEYICFADIIAEFRKLTAEDAPEAANRTVDPATTSMGIIIAAMASMSLLGVCVILRKKSKAR